MKAYICNDLKSPEIFTQSILLCKKKNINPKTPKQDVHYSTLPIITVFFLDLCHLLRDSVIKSTYDLMSELVVSGNITFVTTFEIYVHSFRVVL
jgi:hypothetical protein